MIASLPVYQAVVDALNDETVWPAGLGQAPDSDPPYFVVSPVDPSRQYPPGFRDNGTLEWVGVQVTAVGMRADQCLLLADGARTVLLGRESSHAFTYSLDSASHVVIERHHRVTASDSEGGVHNAHLRIDLLAAVPA